MYDLCGAGQVLDSLHSPTSCPVVDSVIGSKKSQQGAVAIGYLKVVDLIFTLHLKISEVDVDDTALGNFDGFPLVKIVGVVGREVGTRHLSTSWEALGFTG